MGATKVPNVSGEDEDLERKIGKVTLHVLLSLLAGAMWLIPMFVLFGIGQGLGLVPRGIDARPVLLPLAVVAGFVTTWVMERNTRNRGL